ncbi:MAG: VacB/RNase II family 3'-5' exoribonuclease [Candidatus Gracilibacteria bacterium]|nr:VacB/RNase II family 3'-5' exoribonuclease [Candidatus Gracilibacteria bacterium]
MSNKISGCYEDFGSFGMIDGEYLVPAGKGLNAKSGDNVEAISLIDNDNCYEITSIVVEEYINIVQNKIKGIFKYVNSDYGFVDLEGSKKGVYIKSNNIHGAITGDSVEVILFKDGSKNEGIISEILSFRDTPFVGNYIEKNGKSFVESEISGIKNIYPLSKGKNVVISQNDVITFKLKRKDSNNIFGTLVDILGKERDKGIDILKIAASQGARLEFSENVLNEAELLIEIIEQSEIDKREDLRDLFTITIDGPDSKDLDDAISIELLDDGKFKLYVHIADVTHYVLDDSYLDNEALARGTSIYLVDKVIPMLPEKLSNNLCSLNPNTDKLSMTCEMVIDQYGNIDFINSKVYESIINSNFRTTYKEVQDLSDGYNINESNELIFGGIVNDELLQLVNKSKILARILNNKLNSDGELDFNFDETKIKVDNNGHPIGFEVYQKYESNDWIKAFMVSANQTVSKLYEEYPFLHRTHTKPDEKSIKKLQEILNIFELKTDISNLSSKSISNLLLEIKGNDAERFLSKAILLTLHRANYTDKREGHYGLALDYYSHFTSPIRRYPDLQIHRIIKEVISGKFDSERKGFYEKNLGHVALKSSMLEELSVEIERKIDSHMAVKYMSDKIGNVFNGYISSIDNDNIYIELDNTVKGVVNIDKSKYEFNILCEGLFELVDKDGEKTNVGKKVRLKLVNANEANLKISFEIV